MAQIQLVIVTPEKTTLDQMVDAVTLTLYDGEAGVLPGHAPMIGRLGPGELRARVGSEESRFYVEGGNVQVENNVVSVLTSQSMGVEEIDVAAAKASLQAAEAESASTPVLAEMKQKAIAQAQAKIRIAAKS
jgi:F-type H+-transporting ATPase subunit epsilon|tara:strand:- start:670 stop:1065 length:396 start_codon:yes stop_codon:yes gene_type:complete